MVQYRNQWPVNFILHFAELHIGSSISYENTLFRNCFLKCYIVKIILISFNCFSEYIWKSSLVHKGLSRFQQQLGLDYLHMNKGCFLHLFTFLKCYIVKIILISFNCFSEYIWKSSLVHKGLSRFQQQLGLDYLHMNKGCFLHLMPYYKKSCHESGLFSNKASIVAIFLE